MVEVKVLMSLAEDNDAISKKGVRNGEWVKISKRKVHTLLEMEDNDDRKTYLDYLCIDLNYIKEQRNNLLLKHRDLVHKLNTCKEQLLVLKQEKHNFLIMHHVNTEILKENKNLTELKELTTITKTWLNSSNKVNQCISKQIPSQKKGILGVYQLTEYPSSSRQKDLVFIKSSADETKVSIPSVKRPWLSKAEGFILPNHDTGRILLAESQRNITNPLVAVTDSSTTEYDSVGESSVCSTPLSLLKKLDGVEPVSRPKTIKSILRSKSTFKAKTLKGIIINEPSSAPVKGSKISSASKVKSALAGKLKSMKIEDDPPLAIIMKELNNLKLQISKNQEINSRNPQHAFKRCKACGSSTHTTTDHYDIEWFRKSEALQAKKGETLKSTKAESSNANRSKTPTKDLRWCLEMTLHAELKVIALSNVMFDEKRETIFNSNKEVVMIAPRQGGFCRGVSYGMVRDYREVVVEVAGKGEKKINSVVLNWSQGWKFWPLRVILVIAEFVLVYYNFGSWKRIRLKRDKSERNRIKTGQKREAWRSPKNSRTVSVDRARKTEENAKRMVKNANTVEKLLEF
nr:hypothetical protein [Tanacetum cinerariifolium]